MQPTLTRLQSLAENDLTAENAIALIRALIAREENDSALQWADRAIGSGINVAQLYRLRANVLQNLALIEPAYYEETILSYERALLLAPNSAETHKEFGRFLVEQVGDCERAEQIFLRAIEITPNDFRCYLGYAECAIQNGPFREILRASERRLNGIERDTKLLDGISQALINYGRYDEAQECAEVMLGRWPNNLVALATLSRVAEEQRHDFRAAWRYLAKAVKLYPDEYNCYLACFVVLEKTEKWRRARAIFRDVYRKLGYAYPDFGRGVPNWNGCQLNNKTILLDSKFSRGYGDAIHLVGFARYLKEMGATVGVVSRKAVISLLATVQCVDFVVERYSECPEIDYTFDMVFIPYLLDIDMEKVGSAVPYLNPEPCRRKIWEEKLRASADINVGVVWKSSEPKARNQYTARSMPVEELAPLANIPGLRLHSLQKGVQSLELDRVFGEGRITDLTNDLHDFHDTAAAVLALDAIVTVDTSAAHLAGALGKPTFLMLPYSSDSRWLLNRDDSPYYPSLRLFRQEAPGNWRGVVHRIGEAINRAG